MASYQPVTKEIVEQLEKIAPGRVYFGDDVNPDYGRDEMPIYGTRVPEASVDALTTEEIAAVMKLCYENNIPVTTRGAGTGLVGGCVPVMGGVVIATTKMNKLLGYDLDNYTVTVQPGVLLQQLAGLVLRRLADGVRLSLGRRQGLRPAGHDLSGLAQLHGELAANVVDQVQSPVALDHTFIAGQRGVLRLVDHFK